MSQRMLDSAFRRYGVDAVYAPPRGGAPVPCHVIFAQGDVLADGFNSSARISEVRASEVPTMKEEGTLTIGGKTYTIQAARQPDPDRLLWRLELR
ncbi:head-tail joining protein [Azospirillum himalayense]|uniref:Uncharacterized protein n=1 Tax=Azospirillum himalayense TaxID=654847 RepID=A0ABW0GB13_9PROT